MSLLLSTTSAGGSVTGTIAWTQAGDSWALTSNVKVSGAIAVSQGADVWALTGAARVSGTIAVSQAADTWALTGAAVVSGAVSFLQSPDVWALSGNVTGGTVSGAISWTQSADSWGLSGSVLSRAASSNDAGGTSTNRKNVRTLPYYSGPLPEKAIAEMYGDLTEAEVPQKVQKQSAKIVRPFARSGEKIPVAVDFESLQRDAERVSMLLDLWQKQIAESEYLDDEDLLLLGCI